MPNALSPESHFPNTDDVSEVCGHAFQLVLSLQAEKDQNLIRIIGGREVIGRRTSDNRQILIYRDALDAPSPSDDSYEVEFLKPSYVPIEEDSDDPDKFIDKRLFVTKDNPYEFFEADENGDRRPIGAAASKRYAEAIAYSSMTSVPDV